MMSMSYSRRKRSCTISKCNNPKKPQRKPKPSATDVSEEYTNAESFSFNFAVENADVRDDAFVSVEIRIKTERLQARFARRFRRRDARDNRLKNILDADAFLRAARDREFRRNRQHVFQLPFRLRHVRVAEVN